MELQLLIYMLLKVMTVADYDCFGAYCESLKLDVSSLMAYLDTVVELKVGVVVADALVRGVCFGRRGCEMILEDRSVNSVQGVAFRSD